MEVYKKLERVVFFPRVFGPTGPIKRLMEIYEAQDYILRKLKSKAGDVAVIAFKNDVTQQKFVDNEIIMTKNWINDEIVVFLALGKRGNMKTGLTSVPFVSKSKVDSRLNELVKFVNITPPNKDYYAIAQGPFKYKKIDGIFDKKILNMTTKDTGIVVESISKALQIGARKCSGNLDYSFGEGRLLTSNNVDVTEKGTDIKLSFRTFVNENSSSHTIAAASVLSEFKPFEAAQHSAETALRASNSSDVSLPAGRYDILFDPLPFAVLVNQVGSSALMSSVETETSFFGNLLGKKVSSRNFTLYDWGNLPYGLGSGAFDDEGRPTKKTTVVSNGILKNYLHNTSTAKRYRTKSTSNAGILFPEPTNFVVAPGKISQNKLLSNLGDGLYVTNLWYTRFQNYKTGDFSTLPRDSVFLIKGGKIKGVVRDTRVSDNILNMFGNIKCLGDKNTVQRILGWEVDVPSEVPSAIIRKVRVTKPESV